MNDYKFGEEVETNYYGQWTDGFRYCFYRTSPEAHAVIDKSGSGCWIRIDQIRRPRKMVKARFQPMVSIPDGRVEMIKVGEEDEWNGWRAVGNVIQIEVDVNEASK